MAQAKAIISIVFPTEFYSVGAQTPLRLRHKTGGASPESCGAQARPFWLGGQFLCGITIDGSPNHLITKSGKRCYSISSLFSRGCSLRRPNYKHIKNGGASATAVLLGTRYSIHQEVFLSPFFCHPRAGATTSL